MPRFKAAPVALSGSAHERNRHHDDFTLGSLSTITLAHDYLCPWCWVVLFQAKKLTEQYGVNFDWRGYELIPPGMDGPTSPAPKPERTPEPADDTPKPLSRFDLFLVEEGVELPSPRPPFTRTHLALLGAEFAREHGHFDAYNEAVYRAFWEQHKDISDVNVLQEIAVHAGLDGAAFASAVQSETYELFVVPFDDEAYSHGVRHVPTFIFGGEEWLAEANYVDLAKATERFLLRLDKLKKAGKV